MEKLRARLLSNDNFFPPDMMIQNTGWRKEYGKVPGVKLFQTFRSRDECSRAGVHRPLYPGIHAKAQGGISVCVSAGYDNEDYGDRIVYYGTGGQNNPFSGANHNGLIGDQTFDHPMNANLKKSLIYKHPIRVVRGANPRSKYAPAEGYRYDGLYDLISAEYGESRDGYQVCKFELLRRPGQAPIPIKEYI